MNKKIKRAAILIVTFALFFCLTSVHYSFSAPRWVKSAIGSERVLKANDMPPQWQIDLFKFFGCNIEG
jgi:hypothetical protein